MTIALVLSKVAKLIPLLATDSEGECIATVRAITRTLTSAGTDWHELAEVLVPGAKVASTAAAQPFNGYPRKSASPPSFVLMSSRERQEWLDALDRSEGVLNEWERGFIDRLAVRFRHAHCLNFSAKEISVIERMVAKAWGAHG
ncbi:MAG: hypothetical protein Q8M31_23680 [Beijerinckiaceae bacterium]|nr:hypothetical protein [Beijerinckiaceae bacterium]